MKTAPLALRAFGHIQDALTRTPADLIMATQWAEIGQSALAGEIDRIPQWLVEEYGLESHPGPDCACDMCRSRLP